eukprot:scaffold13320_cov215-Alexandrium_tamarense.AAC.11
MTESIHHSGEDAPTPTSVDSEMPQPQSPTDANGLTSRGPRRADVDMPDSSRLDLKDDDGYEEEPIHIPQSSHSLLFTEEVCSLSFAFGLGIMVLSFLSLILALLNNLGKGEPGNLLGIPVQVDSSVRGAQYLAIIIGMLLEEEIPQSFYLLRMIPKHSLKQRFSRMKYWQFVLSATIRLMMGYIFISNMFLVIAQASGVLDIFYDMLALQFIQMLDDIAFRLAKIDVFGKRLKIATSRKCFSVVFERPSFRSRKPINILLKSLYFVNLIGLLSGLIVVSVKQIKGEFHCDSLFITFGDDIWEDSIIKLPNGTISTRVLLYSYFNGNIRKSKSDNDECPWLLRSIETTEYNILDVGGDWSLWAGRFKGGSFSAVCDSCTSDAQCNYHGTCSPTGKCECPENGNYFGNYCEHKKPCPTIRGDWGDTWELRTLNGETWDPRNDTLDSIFIAYDRPIYRYSTGFKMDMPENDAVMLVYTGSRWFGMYFEGIHNRTIEWRSNYSYEFHAFWENAFSQLTRFVSDPTTESTPVAVDMFEITDRGDHYGPMGELTPMRVPRGSGYFQCYERENTTTLSSSTELSF